jgi:hypothetical protein
MNNPLRMMLFAPGIVMTGIYFSGQQATAQSIYTLTATPKTVAWGYYDAKAAPVLRVKSGDNLGAQPVVSGTAAQEDKQPIIYVKHLEPPLHYPRLARQARLTGTIAIKLKVAADGAVSSAESSLGDKNTIGFNVLRADAETLVKTWTFGCVGCAPDAPFEHTIRFRYALDDSPTVQDQTRVTMNLPNEVIIISQPFPCDHCPPAKSPEKEKH